MGSRSSILRTSSSSHPVAMRQNWNQYRWHLGFLRKNRWTRILDRILGPGRSTCFGNCLTVYFLFAQSFPTMLGFSQTHLLLGLRLPPDLGHGNCRCFVLPWVDSFRFCLVGSWKSWRDCGFAGLQDWFAAAEWSPVDRLHYLLDPSCLDRMVVLLNCCSCCFCCSLRCRWTASHYLPLGFLSWKDSDWTRRSCWCRYHRSGCSLDCLWHPIGSLRRQRFVRLPNLRALPLPSRESEGFACSIGWGVIVGFLDHVCCRWRWP